jgi:hypothetical protein
MYIVMYDNFKYNFCEVPYTYTMLDIWLKNFFFFSVLANQYLLLFLNVVFEPTIHYELEAIVQIITCKPQGRLIWVKVVGG